jgi:LysM repeat protein
MGGGPTITVFKFRGIFTDADTRDALVEAARLVGDDIYFRPIPGCGSFQGHTVLYNGTLITLGSTAKSADTHTGYGAVDIDCEGLTDEQARRVETALRRVGFAAWFRPRVSPYTGRSYGWQRHVHAIRLDAPGLPDAAATQVRAYLNGRDGLGVSHPDTGTRAYVHVRWLSYGKPLARTYTIPKGGTLAKAAAALGVTVAALAGWNHVPNPDAVVPGQVVTAPPSNWTPAPVVPSVTVRPSKPVARPVPKPSTPKPTKAVRRAPVAVPATVSRSLLKPGRSNASVLRYERALSARGFLPRRYVDGFYGTATSAATVKAYRVKRWTPRAGVPGPLLLKSLSLKAVK